MSFNFFIFAIAPSDWQTLSALLLLLLPCSLLLPAWLAGRRHPQSDHAWRFAQAITLFALLTTLLSMFVVGNDGPVTVVSAAWLPAVRLDTLTLAMLALTSFLGWVIVRYSRNYLAGDRGRGRYLSWLCLTLAPVWWLVMLNNLLLVCLCWTATGFALHNLLTFYHTRPAAILAAHKKFLISRAADLMTLTATLLVYLNLNTLQIDRITQALATGHPVNGGIELAALLFVLSAILKCAQLPFHGWLLQVMEAPTPVSAMLHAGIVNIGGFILLRLSALLETTPAAQLLLVIAGSITATLAALVMMTRISIKVMLAWSTCAQMGFMLLEIGLGAYSLALLHLLAHSLYKAYAFLNAGETVARQRLLNLVPSERQPVVGVHLLALVGLLLILGLAGFLTGIDPRQEPAMWVLGGAVASTILPLVSAPVGARALPVRQIIMLFLSAFGLASLYGVWHVLFAHLMPMSPTPPGHLALWFAGGCLLSLLIVQHIVLGRPNGSVSRWLHPRAFAGFHLDELVSHIALRVWPTRLMIETKTPAVVLRPDFKNKENI